MKLRGELGVKIYTEDAKALEEAVQKSPERMSVAEMMRGESDTGRVN